MENMFLRVLNMSLSAAAVIAVVALVRLLLRSAPKKWRYLLWSAAGFRLCCPVSFKAFFSIFRLRTAAASAVSEPMQIPALPQTMPTAAPIRIPAAVVTASPIPLDPATVPSVVSATPQVSVPEPVQLWPMIGVILWLCGMAVMLALGIIRYIRMERLLTDAAALEPGVYATDRIRVPFILGLLPPRIYLPAGLEQEEQRFVLAHERVHIRRGDHWIKLLAYLLLAVHWFNPAVWAAFFLMSRDMEMSCDERVLRDLNGSAKAYSRTLLRFAEGRQFPAPAPLGFGESDARSRIKNALRWKRPKLWITLTALVLCIAAVAACTADPKEPEETDASETSAGDTICFARTEGSISIRGTKGSRSFGEILEELAQTDYTYREEENALGTDACLLPGQKQLTVGMDKDSVLLALYASPPKGTKNVLFLAENEPGILLGDGMGGYLRISGVFAGEPFCMSLGYAGAYADLLQNAYLKFGPLDDGEAVYSRIKEALIRQLGEPDETAFGNLSAGWGIPNGSLRVDLTDNGNGEAYVSILLSAAVAADTPWSWTSTLKALDIREAALRSASGPTELLLNWEQIRELTALLKAVPKEQIKGGRGIPSMRVLELRDTGYALRFDGGVIELDCSRPRASTAAAAPAWEIHDEALYAWLDALWAESPFGRADDPLGLTMRAKDVTPTGCTLVFTQSGGSVTGELMTGEKYALFKRDADGVWQDLFADQLVGWLAIGYMIATDGETELETYWGGAFTLEAGQYRIEKEVHDSRGTGDYDTYSIYTEFTIPAGETDDPLGLTMNVKNLTPVGCTLVFWQSGGKVTGSLQTGAAYWLYRLDAEGRWNELTVEEPLIWYDLAFVINRDGETKLEVNWELPFGALEAGHYRIGKEIMDFRSGGDFDQYMIYAEFDISGGLTVSDWFSEIPDGSVFSPFGSYGWEGGFLLLPKAYAAAGEENVKAPEWLYSGYVTQITAKDTAVSFQDGMPGMSGLPLQNHTSAEYLGVEPAAFGQGWYIVRLREKHDLYTAAQIAKLEKQGVDTEPLDLTSEYWTFWLVKEGVDTYYQVSLATKAFSEEEAIRFLRSMTLAGEAGPVRTADWREACRQLFRSALENTDYADYLQGPVQAAGLVDLNGSGLPELILFFPGAGKSHAAAVFTVEEGELRAFNSACAYGLPLARYAADGTFWANDLPAGQFAENGEGFWLLNSGNAAWPAEVWCDWLRFGPAEDGRLTCQSLLSLSVEGEEDDRGTYTETGWRVNGETVTSETYHQAEEEFLRWRDSLESKPFDSDAYLSCREDRTDLPARFDALLEHWQP